MVSIYGKGVNLSMGLRLIFKGGFPINREFFSSPRIAPGLFQRVPAPLRGRRHAPDFFPNREFNRLRTTEAQSGSQPACGEVPRRIDQLRHPPRVLKDAGWLPLLGARSGQRDSDRRRFLNHLVTLKLDDAIIGLVVKGLVVKEQQLAPRRRLSFYFFS
jgi:hypothetical protein